MPAAGSAASAEPGLSSVGRTTDSVSLRFSGPEVMGGGQGNLDVPPFSDGDLAGWAEGPGRLPSAFSQFSFPLLGVDRDMAAAGDSAHGLEFPDLTLVPGWRLRGVLRLWPGSP